ncbi:MULTISPECIES: FadR/GntR family transcriptional regulator [unclassified Streptomyces]|uniref:FadR/GntR family transcriptional regulator n=1 Tax=unclassified Streptomyces TaxID=2593676 RepID=UPI002E28B8DD|nr:FadR/GntR family transcriptional regulator [Streptomyces sp. NBC_00223]
MAATRSHDDAKDNNAAKFARVTRRGASAEAVAGIQDLIRNGQLKAGERLPTERELAEALGLSRPTVREAVQALAAMNILDVRHGTGIFVASLDLATLLAPLWFALELTEPAFDQLYEVRIMLEPYAAQLAAARATDEDLARIQEALQPLCETGLDRESRLSADVTLHRSIIEASHNDLLIGVIASLTVLARKSRELTVELPGREARAVDEHRALVDAIVRKDPEAARQAMQHHLGDVYRGSQEHRDELFSSGD